MIPQLSAILTFMLNAFRASWPLLLITIPIAVAVQLSGASRHIRRVFSAQPVVAIFLATAVGAFSPFCSCSVIPLVASLLIGGVPLAPVMSFWIASPSMDPEVFFLSVAMIGWELAIWRMVATLLLSLSAGLITYFLMKKGWLGENILRTQKPPRVLKTIDLLRAGWRAARQTLARQRPLAPARPGPLALSPAAQTVCCASQPALIQVSELPAILPGTTRPARTTVTPDAPGCGAGACSAPARATAVAPQTSSFWPRLAKETGKAVLMVAKFMALAYLLEALIQLYVPEAWIAGLLGRQNSLSIATAALLGVPVYTSNLAALPLISGLLAQGMNPAAALAFLIAGPVTTLPAMSAVWGLVSRRIFTLYIAFALLGALALGYLYQVVSLF